MYILLGARAEAGEDVLSNPGSEEEEILFAQINKRLKASPGWFTKPLTLADALDVALQRNSGLVKARADLGRWDGHWTEKGHGEAAEATHRFLREKSIIAP